MHLLNIASGRVDDGTEPIDLGQTGGDIVVLSAADTELLALDDALASFPEAFPAARMANFLRLQHNYSVDLYIEAVVSHARFVCVRILGGKAYWPYGLEEICAVCRERKIPLALLSGDEKRDPELQSLSSVSKADYDRLSQYLIYGGTANLRGFWACAARLAGYEALEAPEPEVLSPCGYYWLGETPITLNDVKQHWPNERPVAPLIFYRALALSGATKSIDALINALQNKGLNPLPIFVHSLKDQRSAKFVSDALEASNPDIILNTTGFAVSVPGEKRVASVLEQADCPVLQTVLASLSEEDWEAGLKGLGARDIAMSVALPEVDGRILTRAIAFKNVDTEMGPSQHAVVRHEPRRDRVEFVAEQAAQYVRLRRSAVPERRIALILANYPNKDGRLANGVGLDTPASTVMVMHALKNAGYAVADLPADAKRLMTQLRGGPTNARRPQNDRQFAGVFLPGTDYQRFFETLPQSLQKRVTDRWGAPEADPFFVSCENRSGFELAIHCFGNVAVAIQPARGYNIDPEGTYHDADLVPPHGYLAFYAWLRGTFGAHAVVHLGKHGNLEWLPGKALALSGTCFPEAALGPLPHFYPFIVNDPGEGTQAKRRTSAVIIDHLTPPLTRAESYGALKDLEGLVDEYYEAAGVDARRIPVLRRAILDLAAQSGLDRDVGIGDPNDEDAAISALDNYLCELKEMQIRDGLHIMGEAPHGRLLTDLIVAIARVPRSAGEGRDQSLLRAISTDLGLAEFDPLDCTMGDPWHGPRPAPLNRIDAGPWRSCGDTVERLELLAHALVSGGVEVAQEWTDTKSVLLEIEEIIRPKIRACGDSELEALLTGLEAKFVDPGPSGAPTRGRPEVLPTGRNFYSVDTRSVPTETAWHLGWASAQLLVEDYRQRHGMWPKAMALSAWGTSNMRTGGDDVAQALALMGARPTWDRSSRRVTGFEILPLAMLGRPRVDVTFRISGFFRDAFPAQIDLVDSAARAIMSLDEGADENPLADRYRREMRDLEAQGLEREAAALEAGSRVFGSKPGAYGAGIQALIDEGVWETRQDFAESYLAWGAYAYGKGREGQSARSQFEARLRQVEAIIQNQDNREHDILDSDDYYQFEGGLAATVSSLREQDPTIYHNDHSRPETPKIRLLNDEIGRVVRARAVNPKWIEGVMRHGYKGAFEMAATLDYLFAFAATTSLVKDHHFDLLYEAYLEDQRVRSFIQEHNPAALQEMSQRLLEAFDRGIWQARRNSVRGDLEKLAKQGKE